MLVDVIEAEEFIRSFSWSSRLNADWDFLLHLHNMGARGPTSGWRPISIDSVSNRLWISTPNIFESSNLGLVTRRLVVFGVLANGAALTDCRCPNRPNQPTIAAEEIQR